MINGRCKGRCGLLTLSLIFSSAITSGIATLQPDRSIQTSASQDTPISNKPKPELLQNLAAAGRVTVTVKALMELSRPKGPDRGFTAVIWMQVPTWKVS